MRGRLGGGGAGAVGVRGTGGPGRDCAGKESRGTFMQPVGFRGPRKAPDLSGAEHPISANWLIAFATEPRISRRSSS